MLLDAALLSTGIDDVAGTAREVGARGYAGVWASETDHDPFLPLLTAGLATDHLGGPRPSARRPRRRRGPSSPSTAAPWPTGRCSNCTAGRRWPTSCTHCRSAAREDRRTVLGTFAVVVEPDQVGAAVRARFDGLVDRFSVYASPPAPLELWDPPAAAFRSTSSP